MRRIGGSPTQIWRRLIAQTRPREAALRRLVRAELVRTANLVAGNVSDGLDPMSGIAASEERMRRVIVSAYEESMPVFARPVLDWRGKQEPGEEADVFEAMVAQWVRQYGARKVVNINRTTRNQIVVVLASAREDGLGTLETARILRKKLGSGIVPAARAQTISRTEIHTAANAAQKIAAESLQVPSMRREWVAAEDERTRADHVAANGQVVGMNEPFRVGNDLLQFPGDPTGSPEQIINCRCTVAFVVD